MLIEAIIFDLDGVLTDTAEFHYQAWKRLCNELNLYFDRTINEQLKGVSRQRSFEIILNENRKKAEYEVNDVERFINTKNSIYVSLLNQLSPQNILPGIREFLSEARASGVKLAVASASRNAALVLEKISLTAAFDYIADAALITQAKPEPEIFLDCAKALGVNPEGCIGVEDSQSGIEAIKSAGMTAVGIGVVVTGTAPDINYESTAKMSYQDLQNKLILLAKAPKREEST